MKKYVVIKTVLNDGSVAQQNVYTSDYLDSIKQTVSLDARDPGATYALTDDEFAILSQAMTIVTSGSSGKTYFYASSYVSETGVKTFQTLDGKRLALLKDSDKTLIIS